MLFLPAKPAAGRACPSVGGSSRVFSCVSRRWFSGAVRGLPPVVWTVTGTDGARVIDVGVSTPIAAAVALATVGLTRLLHTPKGPMLANEM